MHINTKDNINVKRLNNDDATMELLTDCILSEQTKKKKLRTKILKHNPSRQIVNKIDKSLNVGNIFNKSRCKIMYLLPKEYELCFIDKSMMVGSLNTCFI